MSRLTPPSNLTGLDQQPYALPRADHFRVCALFAPARFGKDAPSI